MATNSPRTGLILPEDGDYQDAAVLANNFSKIDQNIGAFVCTSTTRPTSPYNGQLILETDTGIMRIYQANHPSVQKWVYAGGRESYAKYRRDATDAGNPVMLGGASGWTIWPNGGSKIESSNGSQWYIQNGYPSFPSKKWYAWDAQVGFLSSGDGGPASNNTSAILRVGLGVIDYGDANRAGHYIMGVGTNSGTMFVRASGVTYCDTGILQLIVRQDSTNSASQTASNTHTWVRFREID